MGRLCQRLITRFSEYWNYLDRPETFVAYAAASVLLSVPIDNPCSIGDSNDDLGRMLEVLRFWFTKDLVRFPLLGRSNEEGAHIVHRSTSKGSRASHTTLRWESSFGYVKYIEPTLQHSMILSSV